ncbi:hypothetical protein D9M71_318870 [compost metagenome]
MLIAHIQRRDHAAQVTGKKLQDVAPQHLQAQLPQYLFGQFGLAGAQPGLLLQAHRAVLLGLEIGRITVRQGEQVAPPNERQQAAEHHHEQQVQGAGQDRGAADVFVAGHP